MTIHPFADSEGFTPLTNYLLDTIMPSLPASAWKVLCFILRKTRGWQKEEDRLSYGQIEAGTGISSSATVSTAIKILLEKNYIIKVPGSAWRPMGYRINSALEIEVHEESEVQESFSDSTLETEPHSTLKIKVTPKIKAHSNSKTEPHSALKIKDTTERDLKKEKERLPRADRAPPNPDHKRLMALYQEALDHKIPNGPKEALGAKKILDASYTPEQAIDVYRYLKAQAWWRDKHLSLLKVYEEMGAVLAALNRNGHRNGIRQSTGGNPERRPQVEADLDKPL